MSNHCLRVLVIVWIALLFNFLPSICISSVKKPALPCSLLEIPVSGAYRFGNAIFVSDQNKSRVNIIKRLLKGHFIRSMDLCSKDTSLKTYQRSRGPTIEYRKISSTKYRVRIHGIRQGFPLIFNETFDDGWKAYIVPWGGENPGQVNRFLHEEGWTGNHDNKIMTEKNWASSKEINTYIEHGWITDLAGGANVFEDKRLLAKKKVQFIAKKQGNTIQNDNLHPGGYSEVWLADAYMLACKNEHSCDPLKWENWGVKKNWNSDAIEWPALFHWEANTYANSWWIDPGLIRKLGTVQGKSFYHDNAASSMDVEIILEYVVQKWFDIGLLISLVAFALVIWSIIYSLWKWLFLKIKG